MLFLAIAYVCARGCWPRLVLICIVHSLERVLTLFACRTMAKRLKRLETALFCKFGYVLAHMSGSYGKHSCIWPETGNGSGKGAGSGSGWKKAAARRRNHILPPSFFHWGGNLILFLFLHRGHTQGLLKMAKTCKYP